MALDKMTGSAGLNPMQPMDGIGKGPASSGIGKDKGPDSLEFRMALEQAGMQTNPAANLQKSAALQASNMVGATTATGGVGATAASTFAAPLKFSNHAIERMHSRGISFQPDEMRNIQSAIAKAAQKGSKDTLVLSGDNALIVSVKNNTVVTVMDKAAMKDNVFTNIDSTVVI